MPEGHEVALPDGGKALLRVMRPDDRAAFVSFHAGLSPETRHWRYFSSRPELPDDEVAHYTTPDPRVAQGIAAWVGGEIVGHACYDRVSPDEAEAAFVVADAYQGHGLGTALFEALAVEGRAQGFRRFVATVMLGNRRMFEVFRNLGFTERTHRESSLVKVEIELEETERHREAARERRVHAEDGARQDGQGTGPIRGILRRGLLVALLPLWACVGIGAPSEVPASPRPAPPAMIEAGRRDYREHCAVCHGTNAQGNGPAARALRVAPADLTTIAARRRGVFPELDIAYVIDGRFEIASHGPREMPIWGTQLRQTLPQNETGEAIVRGRIESIVAYLASIQR